MADEFNPLDDALIDARLEGYEWPEINDHLDMSKRAAQAEGYSSEEIANYLGTVPDDSTQARLSADAGGRAAHDEQFVTGLRSVKQSIPLTPLEALPSKRIATLAGREAPEAFHHDGDIPDAGLDLHDSYARNSYASALLRGDIRSPQDFADRYAAAAWGVAGDDADGATVVRAAAGLADTLPSNEELTDQAIALAHSQGVALDRDGVRLVRNNLIEEWASTGTDLQTIYAQAQDDPDYAAKLVTPKTTDQLDLLRMTAAADIVNSFQRGVGTGFTTLDTEELQRRATELGKNAETLGMTLGTMANPVNWIMGALNLAQRYGEAMMGGTPLTREEAFEGALLGIGGSVIKGRPMAKQLDPAAAAGQAIVEKPGPEVLLPPKPAEIAPPKATAEGAAPEPLNRMEFVPEATPAEKMQALSRGWLEDKARVMEDLRLQNLGVVPDEFGPRFFQELAAKQDAPTQELARGMDTARGILGYLADLGGRLMRDESGALSIFNTPQQAAEKALRRENRNYGQELIIQQRSLGERDVAHLAYGFDHTKTLAGDIENSYRLLNPHMKEWERELDKGPAGNPMGTMIGNLIQYVEGRSMGAALRHDSPLAPVADQFRYTAQFLEDRMRDAQARGLHDVKGYYTDYFRHMWKDPNAADIAFGVGRQGSGASFKLRSIPTVEDGLRLGLEPAIRNPIALAMFDAGQKIKYLRTLEMLDKAHTDGKTYWSSSGPKNPEDVALQGIGTEKPFPMSNSGAGIMRLYANRGFATPWNDWLDLGLYKRPAVASTYEKLMFAKNTMTGIQLALPLFHTHTMMMETWSGRLANALTEISRGEVGRGAWDLIKTPTAPIEQAIRGDRILRDYRNLANDPIIDYLTQAGSRFGPRQEIYKMGSAPNIVESITRRSLGNEYRDLWRHITEVPTVASVVGRSVGFLGHEVGRVLNTITAPLFDYFIPRLKAGVNYERMQTYIRQNPTASQEQIMRRAREIVNNTDERMGEMNMDNVFWPRAVKQMAQLMMISPGWVYGSVRFYASAVGINLERRAFQWNPTATTALVGFVGAYALENMAYQYLKSGQLPWDNDTPLRDILFPRTGARTPEGAPERALLPSQFKELVDYAKIVAYGIHNPMTVPQHAWEYAAGKMPGIWQLVRGLATGEDAIGHHIGETVGGWPGFFKRMLLPIFVQNYGERKKGTGLSMWESLIGIRNPHTFAENPERFYKGLETVDAIHARDEYRRAVRENARLETPRELPEAPGGAGGTGRGGGGGGYNPDPYANWGLRRSGRGGYNVDPYTGWGGRGDRTDGGGSYDPSGMERVDRYFRDAARAQRGPSGGTVYSSWGDRRRAASTRGPSGGTLRQSGSPGGVGVLRGRSTPNAGRATTRPRSSRVSRAARSRARQ